MTNLGALLPASAQAAVWIATGYGAIVAAAATTALVTDSAARRCAALTVLDSSSVTTSKKDEVLAARVRAILALSGTRPGRGGRTPAWPLHGP